MACNLTQGSTIGCINSIGGIKTIYLADLSEVLSYTISAGTISAMAMSTGKKFWTYKLEKNNASFVQSLKKNIDNGTKYYEFKYDWNIKKMSVAFSQELNIMSEISLVAIHLDSNGVYWLTGLDGGLDLMTNEAGSGKAKADLNGYTVSITGQEPAPAYSISSAIVATLIVAAA